MLAFPADAGPRVKYTAGAATVPLGATDAELDATEQVLAGTTLPLQAAESEYATAVLPWFVIEK